jgi:hypothetical protein
MNESGKTLNQRTSNRGSTVHTRKGSAVSSRAQLIMLGGLHHMSYTPLVLGPLRYTVGEENLS